MADITQTSLKFKFSNYCVQRLKGMTANKNYISSDNLKSEIVNYYKGILNENQNTLSEDDYNSLRKYYENYAANFIEEYNKNIVKNNSVASGFSSTSALDTDPTVVDGKTYINGKKLKVFSDYTGTNATYSMADMVANIGIDTEYGTINAALGELQTISYSIYQRKEPVRVLGNMNAKDWVFGPRTIAGSLVFAVFNKHWLMDLYDNLKEKAGMKNWHFIGDEIPPFNITLTFANEYGFDSRMVLYGVRLMNEGQTMSTNDIYIENTYEFVANDIDLMDSLRAYEIGTSSHQRGAVIDNTKADTVLDNNNITVTPIDRNKANQTQIKSEYTDQEFNFSDTMLNKMDKKLALKNLSQIKKAWLEEYKNDKEMKNRINADYKIHKERIEEYYNSKEVKDSADT